MLNSLRKIVSKFLESKKEIPLMAGIICGFYPFIFYYSNNYFAINSWQHLLFFSLFFIASSLIIFAILFFTFKRTSFLKKYRLHLLFFLCIAVTSFLLSQAMYLTIKKKILLIVWTVAFLASFKLFNQYKKVLILIIAMSVIPTLKTLVSIYENVKSPKWSVVSDNISETKYFTSPNIYLIQPDGYVSESVMTGKLYSYKSDLYSWLDKKEFKVYNDFRSNYLASLTSNASMFAMKHHEYGKMIFPSIELPNARDIICGDNVAISILKRNNYTCFFVVQDEYFQQNRTIKNYDYTNIEFGEIPFFSNDNNVKKDVFEDLKSFMRVETNSPKFFFVEKLLPHHVHFSGDIKTRLQDERDLYIDKIEEVNVWLKSVVDHISSNDPNGIIIILADHGGWVGIESYNDMFSTNDEKKIVSIFSSLAAIKWNGHNDEDYDKDLVSNVNLFRVLFSALSKDPKLLENLEDNSSYNLNNESLFLQKVKKVINNQGEILN